MAGKMQMAIFTVEYLQSKISYQAGQVCKQSEILVLNLTLVLGLDLTLFMRVILFKNTLYSSSEWGDAKVIIEISLLDLWSVNVTWKIHRLFYSGR